MFSGNFEDRYETARSNLAANWDSFYANHDNKFFKNRAWLFTEFTNLDPKIRPDQTVLEIGMGNGSNIIPLIEASQDMPEYRIFGCDFSQKSVEIVQEHELVKNSKDKVNIFQHDISTEEEFSFPPNSIDSVIITFVLSGIVI